MAYYIDENKKTAVKCEGKNAFAWNALTRRFDAPTTEVTPKSRMMRCSEFDARRFLFEADPNDYGSLADDLLQKLNDMPDRDPGENLSVAEAEAFIQECAAERAQFEPHLTNFRNGVQAYVMDASEYGRLIECVELFLSKDELIAQLALQLAKGNEQLAQLKAEQAKCERGHCEECKWYNSCDKHPNPDNPVNPV